jgi:hypothetical protein
MVIILKERGNLDLVENLPQSCDVLITIYKSTRSIYRQSRLIAMPDLPSYLGSEQRAS